MRWPWNSSDRPAPAPPDAPAEDWAAGASPEEVARLVRALGRLRPAAPWVPGAATLREAGGEVRLAHLLGLVRGVPDEAVEPILASRLGAIAEARAGRPLANPPALRIRIARNVPAGDAVRELAPGVSACLSLEGGEAVRRLDPEDLLVYGLAPEAAWGIAREHHARDEELAREDAPVGDSFLTVISDAKGQYAATQGLFPERHRAPGRYGHLLAAPSRRAIFLVPFDSVGSVAFAPLLGALAFGECVRDPAVAISPNVFWVEEGVWTPLGLRPGVEPQDAGPGDVVLPPALVARLREAGAQG